VASGGLNCSYCDTSCNAHVITGAGSITGRVLSATRFDVDAVLTARVSLDGDEELPVDAEGYFAFEDVPAGPHQLTVTAPSVLSLPVAYSTTSLRAPVRHGEATDFYPRLLEGCIMPANTTDLPPSLNVLDTCPWMGLEGGPAIEPGDLAALGGDPHSGDFVAEVIRSPRLGHHAALLCRASRHATRPSLR
jgi:hypothetical protein